MAYDAIVIGVGTMGAQAALHLARRRKRVLALEQFDIGHAYGSSHGEHRIIRLAYFEHPLYVPLLRRALKLWRALEKDAATQLLFQIGSLDIGREREPLFSGSLRSCIEHGLPHEVLSAAELAERYRAFQVPTDYKAVFQPDGGFLACEQSVQSTVQLARAAGADIRTNQHVLELEAGPRGSIRVQTADATYEAETAILTAGPWIGQLLPDYAHLLVPERQVLAWFKPKDPTLFAPDMFPVANILSEFGHHYQLPIWETPGVKVGLYHHKRQTSDVDAMDRAIKPDDTDILRDAPRSFYPSADGDVVAAKTCIFTNTPDGHFILGPVPTHPGVVIGAACSGHGFKFAPLIGEVLADFATGKTPAFDLSPFIIERFSKAA